MAGLGGALMDDLTYLRLCTEAIEKASKALREFNDAAGQPETRDRQQSRNGSPEPQSAPAAPLFEMPWTVRDKERFYKEKA